MSIRVKLTATLLIFALAVIASMGILSSLSLDNYFRDRIISELMTQSEEIEYLIRTSIKSDSSDYARLQTFAASARLRLTLISPAGSVLFESDLSHSRLSEIENHSDRDEIRIASKSGTGTSVRHSRTLNTDMLYFARRLDLPFPEKSGYEDAKFIRLSVSLTSVSDVMNEIHNKIIIIGSILLLFVLALALGLSTQLSKPIETMASYAEQISRGNYEVRLPLPRTKELRKLAETINGTLQKVEQDIIQLKKLERVRSEFLGNVSHELRTPIFTIQGLIETLLGGAVDDKTVNRDFLDRALQNTQRLNTLLTDLIEISRIESGEMKMSFRYFPINELLEQVRSEMEYAAEQKSIEISIQTKDKSPEVYGDRERLKQVFINLVDNSIKYSRSGSKVTLECDDLEDKVLLSVRDNGPGIAGEHIPRIFERFYRVDKERSRDEGGTGLGLAIVKHIVEAHGCRVDVRSELGRGTTFSFALKK